MVRGGETTYQRFIRAVDSYWESLSKHNFCAPQNDIFNLCQIKLLDFTTLNMALTLPGLIL